MTKFAFFSLARHGTDYFVNSINAGDNNKHIFLEEDLIKKFSRFTELANATSVSEIKNILEISKCYDAGIIQYFYNRIAVLESYAKKNNINVIGFKIFPKHVSFKDNKGDIAALQEIINYVDKIIILDRDDLEFCYSYAHAKRIKDYSRTKGPRIFLTSKEIHMLIAEVINKHYFFETIKCIAANLNKSCVILHYNELGVVREKINRVFGINLKHWLPYEKNVYDYEQFLSDNPGLINYFNNTLSFFKKETLPCSALSGININANYEYHI